MTQQLETHPSHIDAATLLSRTYAKLCEVMRAVPVPLSKPLLAGAKDLNHYASLAYARLDTRHYALGHHRDDNQFVGSSTIIIIPVSALRIGETLERTIEREARHALTISAEKREGHLFVASSFLDYEDTGRNLKRAIGLSGGAGIARDVEWKNYHFIGSVMVAPCAYHADYADRLAQQIAFVLSPLKKSES